MQRKLTVPLVVLAAIFVLAGGFIHYDELTSTYDALPSSAPGADVIKIGFPLNVLSSVVVAVALVLAAFKRADLLLPAIIGAAVFQLGSLAILVFTRNATFLGWTEPNWTAGAKQSLAVEIGALVCLALAFALRQLTGASTDAAPTPA